MPAMTLLTLDLRSEIFYLGLDHPPPAKLGEDIAEGEEELFLFDEAELIAFDPDDGPTLRRPLPKPRFYGRRRSASVERPGRSLAAGTYAFLQWRPSGEEGLLEGLEWFARESWWESRDLSGPYILRRVREDGRLATQVLRKMI